MNCWTLQRQLQEQTSFRALELRAKSRESRRLLRETSLSVAEISDRLGFSSQSAYPLFQEPVRTAASARYRYAADRERQATSKPANHEWPAEETAPRPACCSLYSLLPYSNQITYLPAETTVIPAPPTGCRPAFPKTGMGQRKADGRRRGNGLAYGRFDDGIEKAPARLVMDLADQDQRVAQMPDSAIKPTSALMPNGCWKTGTTPIKSSDWSGRP